MIDQTHVILQTIVNVLVSAGGFGAIIFAISYGFFFKWRKTQSGRALMYFVLSLSALFASSILGHFLGTGYTGRDELQLVIYGSVGAAVWNLTYQLWTNYRTGNSNLIDVTRRDTASKSFTDDDATQ